MIPVTHCLDTGVCNPIWFDERATETDDAGRFEIDAVPSAGVSFDILREGYSEQRDVTLKLDGAPNDIQLQTGGAIRGTVVDRDGKPVRNFKIRVMIPRGLERGEPGGGYYAGFDWYGISFTRDDGVFVLSGIGANSRMRLIVSSPGVGRAVLNRVKAQPLDQLSPPHDLTIELQPYTPLAVQAVDARSGQPIADALVTLLEDNADFSHGFNWGYHDLWGVRQRTDAQGWATFVEPACEDGTILVHAAGFARSASRGMIRRGS